METSILKELHQSQKTPLPGRAPPTAAGPPGWFYLSPQIKCTGTHESSSALMRGACAKIDKTEAPRSPPIKVEQEQAAPASLDLSSALAETA